MILRINVPDILALLNSNISTYRINKDTGIPQSSLTGYRNRKLKISNMTLSKASKLQKYYFKLHKEDEI